MRDQVTIETQTVLLQRVHGGYGSAETVGDSDLTLAHLEALQEAPELTKKAGHGPSCFPRPGNLSTDVMAMKKKVTMNRPRAF